MSISSHETLLYTPCKRNASGIFVFFRSEGHVFYFIQFTVPVARRFLPCLPRPMHPPLSKRLLFDLNQYLRPARIPANSFRASYSILLGRPSLCSNENPPPQRLIITALQRGKQSVYLSDCLIHLHCVAAETMRSAQFSAQAAESHRAGCTPVQRESLL